jgi:biotin carboxyl carrier protein
MDLRKLKTLIDLVSDSNVTELEITEAEGKVRIVKGATPSGAPVLSHQVMAPAAPALPSAPVAPPTAAEIADAAAVTAAAVAAKLPLLAILSSRLWWALSTGLLAQVLPPLSWWATPSKRVTPFASLKP